MFTSQSKGPQSNCVLSMNIVFGSHLKAKRNQLEIGKLPILKLYTR